MKKSIFVFGEVENIQNRERNIKIFSTFLMLSSSRAFHFYFRRPRNFTLDEIADPAVTFFRKSHND